ncbi:alpha/beta fold hydrolase [Shewanella sp. Scap07]|uniref:esterase/lipase family protein n=1 Tax=Shewanella sp. Scap07 TaxID=2589987 RepID=UPI0015B827A4|nr:alpha/beta fold hydrolase [Shewanella sp. Scap07]QLE86971.1 alpha/beta fold hydrolase [Shewanella sp. Scap07]
MNIVLVHGIFNTGVVMRRLQRMLQDAGHQCSTPTLSPFDGRLGIVHAAHQLERHIKETYANQTVVLVGFSMGGIICRYYAQHVAQKGDVSHLFSIAAPHHGSYLAYLPYPSITMKQLRPNSEFLQQLRDDDVNLDGIKLFSYRTPLDFTIIPSRSSVWPAASNQLFWIPLHLSMVLSSAVGNAIEQQLAQTN